MRTLRAFIVVATVLCLFPQRAAAVQYLSISWNSVNQRTINYKFDGANRSLTISPAVGHLDTQLDGLFSSDTQTVTPLFCVDVFQDAFDADATPGHNHEYSVMRHTSADGLAGWTTPGPASGTDYHRDHGSLARAAFLANTFGRSFLTAQQKVALNVAIWKAAYGDRFEYVNGLAPGGQTTAFNNYIAAYNSSATLVTSDYIWYDNASDDQSDHFQDFIQPVPEPGTLMLLGTALIGAGGIGMRRRQKKA